MNICIRTLKRNIDASPFTVSGKGLYTIYNHAILMSLVLPSFLDPFKTEILFILFFVDGLLIGLAIRKGATALILVIIAVAIAGFAGITFIPSISVTSIVDYVINYAKTAKFGLIVVTSTVVVFVVGLIIGLLKK